MSVKSKPVRQNYVFDLLTSIAPNTITYYLLGHQSDNFEVSNTDHPLMTFYQIWRYLVVYTCTAWHLLFLIFTDWWSLYMYFIPTNNFNGKSQRKWDRYRLNTHLHWKIIKLYPILLILGTHRKIISCSCYIYHNYLGYKIK